MHLRAEIFVDLEAQDFVDAAEHQQWLSEVFERVRSRYPAATYDIRARRAPMAGERTTAPLAVKRGTGRLNRYANDDV